jgi:23S rRNA (adenine2503-C2)-methyltransferase
MLEIVKNIKVPTGNILIVNGQRGKLELLSIGDYGQAVNLNQHKKVVHQEMLPLEEKWVITISTQYGCSIGCSFCDVPKVGPGVNATAEDLIGQIEAGLSLHPDVETKRLNVHFARMGEPTFNNAIFDCAGWLHRQQGKRYRLIHPVISTMMPSGNHNLSGFIHDWMRFKNGPCNGDAGLQISINSTNEEERRQMFNDNALPLSKISAIAGFIKPRGRKITLNFAVAEWEINPDVLRRYFDPDIFIIKLTPMHKTLQAIENGIRTVGDYTESYPYENHEAALRAAGFDVLVFIASVEEDLGRITCGNAILSGSMPGLEGMFEVRG